MVTSLRQWRIPRPLAILLAALLAMAFTPLITATSARAAGAPAIAIDGDLTGSVSSPDWSSYLDKGLAVAPLVVHNDNTEGPADSPNDYTVFSTSSKENAVVAGEQTPGTWSAGSPGTAPPKADIGNVYKYVTAEDDHLVLYFAWDRLAPSGTDYYYLELNRKPNTTTGSASTYYSVPNRSIGDVRFTLAELGNSKLGIVQTDEWAGTSGWKTRSTGSGGFDGLVNAQDISPAGFSSPATAATGPHKDSIPADQFAEVRFDLTNLLQLAPDCPARFGTLNFRTSTGAASDTTGDNLKDYIAPLNLDAPTTCGTIKIVKTFDGLTGDLPAATFQITPNPFVKDDATPYEFSTDSKGQFTIDGVIPRQAYTIHEVSAPEGFQTVKDQTVPALGDSQTVTVDITDPRLTYPLTVTKLAAGTNLPIQGAVFELYGDDPRNGGTSLGEYTTDSHGVATSASVAWGESPYYWKEVSVPEPYNLPAQTVQGPVVLSADGSTTPAAVTFVDDQTSLTTRATNGRAAKTAVTDTATLSGIPADAGGTLVFKLYGPSDTPVCETPIWDSSDHTTITVHGPGDYTVTGPTLETPGNYYWRAFYSGDDSRGVRGAAGSCGEDNETSTVVPSTAGISTVVPHSAVALGTSTTTLTDQATLQVGGDGTPTGTIDFTLYGPLEKSPQGDSSVCTEANQTGTDSTTLDHGAGDYTTPHGVTVTDPGWYVWVASYSGDATFQSASETCGQAAEIVHVLRAPTAVTTTASASSTVLGGTTTYVSDSVTLAGGTSTTKGSLDFTLYGPFDAAPSGASCTAGSPVAGRVSVDVSGAGGYSTPGQGVAVTKAGFYSWAVSFTPSQDSTDTLGSQSACGDPMETVHVDLAPTQITTEATTSTSDAPVRLPAATISDKATVTGVTSAAGGDVTFSLYGPSDTPVCTSEPVFTDKVALRGDHTATSGGYTPTQAGTYWWVANYSGDAGNAETAGKCGDANEQSVVLPAAPSISTQAGEAPLLVGGSVSLTDAATLTGATGTPTGTISFQLYGPYGASPDVTDQAACLASPAGDPVAKEVTANGDYTSPAVTVTARGYYTWVATYGGDGNNLAAKHECGLPDETVFVGQHDLSIVKDVNKPDAVRGDVLTYTITVAAGPDVDETNVVVRDPLPAGITFVSADKGGTAETAGGVTTVTWKLGSLAKGTHATVTFTATVDKVDPDPNTGEIPGATIHNVAYAMSDDVPEKNDDATTVVPPVTIVGPSGLSVLKTVDKAEADFGDTLTYGLTATVVRNPDTVNGTAIQSNVTITDPIPAGTTYVPGSASCKVTSTDASLACIASESDGKVTATVAGSLEVGGTLSLTFKVTINSPAVGTDNQPLSQIVNSGAVSSKEVPSTPSNEVVTRLLTHALSIVKDVDASSAARGTTLTYTIKVSAGSSADETNVVVRDPLPGDITYVTGSASNGGTASVVGGVTTLTWNLGTLPKGTGATVTFKATIKGAAADPATGAVPGASIDNVAYVKSDRVSEIHDDALTVVPSTVIVIVGPSGLTVVKTVDKTTAKVGDTLTYGVTTTVVRGTGVNGSAVQSGVTVKDVVPVGTTYVADSAECATTTDPSVKVDCTPAYDAATRTVSATASGDLAIGDTLTLTFKVTINNPATGPDGKDLTQVTNAALVSSSSVGELPSNEVVTKLTSVEGVIVEQPGTTPTPTPTPTPVVQPVTLPRTGAQGVLPLGASGLALLGLGLALIALGQRRRPGRVPPRHGSC